MMHKLLPKESWVLLLAALSLLGSAAASELDCEGAAVEIILGFPDRQQAVYGYPALFGTLLNDTATPAALLEEALPLDGCDSVQPASQPGAVALVSRGNCSFLQKAQALQAASFGYMILYDSEPGCVLMSAGNASAPPELSITAASVTQDAGQLLLALAAQGGNVTLRAPTLPRVDLASAAALWVMAVGTVVAGSLWSAAELRWQLGERAGQLPGQEPRSKGRSSSEGDVTVITTKSAVAFIFVASAVLLLLYFFLSTWFALLMIVLFAFGSWQTLSLVLWLLLLKLTPEAWAKARLTLSLLGRAGLLQLVSSATAAAVAVVWFVWRHSHWAWALQDVLGISLMLVILQQLRLPNLRVACILLPLAFLYDVWWVFLQPVVTGGDSVMIAVATGSPGEQLPMLLEVPRRGLGSNTGYAMLGFGDVILPGLLAVLAARFDAAAGLSHAGGYFVPVTAGYGMGLVLTYFALAFSIGGSQGQPALLYLVPCTLGAISLAAWRRRQLGELWHCAVLEGPGQERGAAGGEEESGQLEAGLGGDSERRALLPAGSPSTPTAATH